MAITEEQAKARKEKLDKRCEEIKADKESKHLDALEELEEIEFHEEAIKVQFPKLFGEKGAKTAPEPKKKRSWL